MKAVVWKGTKDVAVDNVPEPKVVNSRDAVVKITSTAICGSDLHLYNGFIPAMKAGDILGHEFMGEIIEVGKDVKNLKKGDRVVVPFAISCGGCFFCQHKLFSLCDNTNPNASTLEKLYGYSGAGLFGYSHLYGGYAGGQAQYARVPFADVGPICIPDSIEDEKVLFLSDILPTAYQAVENCGIQPGDSVAVWGCGPVGQLAIRCAFMLGAERVIAIEHIASRREMAEQTQKVETLDSDDPDLQEKLRTMTGGHGPDHCIDAVGMEAHGHSIDAVYDRAKQALMMETDRPHALRQAILACRKGGTVSIPGVYGGFLDKFPMGAAFAKGLTLKMGQTHVQRYLRPLLERIERGELDPSFIITHRYPLDDAAKAYETFAARTDDCVKVVMKP
jgi:2-desacetyl-2-hydroxyethyl bacteriochlorophyllide A dehydrogenase